MRLENLNLYLDGLLGLTKTAAAERSSLIEEAAYTSDIKELLQDWLWLQELGEASCLKLKIWFGLTYRELGEVYNLNHRDVAQLIKNKRSESLPTYPPLSRSQETEKIAGISCFMVEQHFSAWLDSELNDPKTQEAIHFHIHECVECASRLENYRRLQADILKQRPCFDPVVEAEWKKVLRDASKRRRERFIRYSYSVLLILIICAFLAWVIWSKPDKMPNVYEL